MASRRAISRCSSRTSGAGATESASLAGLLQVLEISPLAMPELLESAQHRYATLASRYAV